MAHATEETCHMRRDESDEADDACFRDEHGDDERRQDDEDDLQALDLHAERRCLALSEQQHVERMTQQPCDEYEQADDDRDDREVVPMDARKAAEQPEHGAAHLRLVLRAVDEQHRERGKNR